MLSPAYKPQQSLCRSVNQCYLTEEWSAHVPMIISFMLAKSTVKLTIKYFLFQTCFAQYLWQEIFMVMASHQWTNNDIYEMAFNFTHIYISCMRNQQATCSMFWHHEVFDGIISPILLRLRLYDFYSVNWGWNKNKMNNFSVPSVTAMECIKPGMQINLLPVSFISVLGSGMGDSRRDIRSLWYRCHCLVMNWDFQRYGI